MKNVVKRLVQVVLGFVLLIVAAALIVPAVIDVDKYRPQIVAAAQDKINGQLELGKLSLSLWGQIRVQVQGVSLKDPAGASVLSVKDAYFHFPFLSLLTGSPEAILRMDHPELRVEKNQAGELNLMKLIAVKKEAAAPQAAGTPTVQPSAAVQVPGIVAASRFGFEMRHALVSYSDVTTQLKSSISDLNLVLKDVSLSRKMSLEMWAQLDTEMGKSLRVKGPAKFSATVKPELSQGSFERAQIEAKFDLGEMEVDSTAGFKKGKTIPLNGSISLTASPKDVKIEQLLFKFHNAELRGSGLISNVTPAAGAAPSPLVSMVLVSNEIDFKPWNELLPQLKQLELAGKAKLDANLNGPSDRLNYKARFVVSGFSVKVPTLKAVPRFDLAVAVETDQVQDLELKMKAPGNEFVLKGSVKSFTHPFVALDFRSEGMDLDQLIHWPPPVVAASAEGAHAGAGGSSKSLPQEDLDALLDPLRNNPMAAATTVNLNFNIASMQAKLVKMQDMSGRAHLKDLAFGVDAFSMKMWKGAVRGGFSAQMRPKTPTYSFNVGASGLQLRDAVAEQNSLLKNTLMGVLKFDMNGSGRSFNTDAAKANLAAKGSMRVDQASFATIDVSRAVVEGLNKAMERVGEKVPAVKGRSFNIPGGRDSRYEFMSSDFSIQNGKFFAPNFVAKAEPNSGIDLKGTTEVGLKDLSLATRWEISDTYNLTHARDLSVDVAGTKVEHLLAEGNQPVRFTVEAGCTCLKPCYSYTEVPEQLTKVALNNLALAAADRAKSELRKKAESVIPKAAPPVVQDALKGLGKKLFR